MDTQLKQRTPRTVEIPVVPHAFGDLGWFQTGDHLPFAPQRIFFISGIPEHAVRGGHSHHLTGQFILAISGAVTTKLEGPLGETASFRLDTVSKALAVPPGWWLDLTDFLPGSCLLVAASHPYDEADYIRDLAEFRAQRA